VVLPYVEASQSGVVPTAYGFKKPIIATNVGSIDEIVDDGKTGLIVPCQDPRALAEAIIKLLNDDELRKKWGKKGLLS
jgi:glycosyltransferase involved in cell wall biosynthesis